MRDNLTQSDIDKMEAEIEYRKLTLRPQPGRELGYTKAEWKSPVGTIRSAWEYRGDMLHFDFEVPIPAAIVLPNGDCFDVEEGEHHYEILL